MLVCSRPRSNKGLIGPTNLILPCSGDSVARRRGGGLRSSPGIVIDDC